MQAFPVVLVVDLLPLLENAVLAFALSVVLAALAWAVMARMKPDDDDPRELFKGTLSGSFKLFAIYFVFVPALGLLGLSAQSVQLLSVLLTELSILLGIQLFSYIFTHLIRAHKEALALGIIGGITRSEAVSGSMTSLVKEDPGLMDTAVIVILAANATMLARTLFLLLLIPVVGATIFFEVLPPILGMFLVSLAIIYYTYKNGNPVDIKLRPISVMMAVQIVLAFAVVSALSAFAGSYGNSGYYLIAALGALAGALPVVISTVALLAYRSLPVEVAANIILIAVTIGFVNDSLVAALFKQVELFRKLAYRYALVLLGGLAGYLLQRRLLDLSVLPPYTFLLLFLLVFIPVLGWLFFRKKDPELAKTLAWGLFGALVNVVLIFIVLPLLPASIVGVNVRALLYIIAAIVLIQLLMFLYTHTRQVKSLTTLGFVVGFASAESLTFTLSKHAPEPAAKMIFAAKSSMCLRNLAILFALSSALALRIAPLLLAISALFLIFSLRVRSDEHIAVKPSSIPSVAFLFALLLLAGMVSKFSLQYLGLYGLYVSTALLSFSGLLPPMLSIAALFSLKSITTEAALALLSLSVLVTTINDVAIARVFGAKELSAALLKKEAIAFVVTLAVLFFAQSV